MHLQRWTHKVLSNKQPALIKTFKQGNQKEGQQPETLLGLRSITLNLQTTKPNAVLWVMLASSCTPYKPTYLYVCIPYNIYTSLGRMRSRREATVTKPTASNLSRRENKRTIINPRYALLGSHTHAEEVYERDILLLDGFILTSYLLELGCHAPPL